MQCPRCGVEQPEGEECIACGIIFAKIVDSSARSRATMPPSGATPVHDQGPIESGAPLAASPAAPSAGGAHAGGAAMSATEPAGHVLQGHPQGAPHLQGGGAGLPQTDPFAPAQPASPGHASPAATPPPHQDPYGDPFAAPPTPAPSTTAPTLDAFGQPITRQELPPAASVDPNDPFAPLSAQGSESVTVQTQAAPGWQQELETQTVAQSGMLSGNVHDMATIPPESYAISPVQSDPMKTVADAVAPGTLSGMHESPLAAEASEPPAPATRTRDSAGPARSRFQRARPEESESIHPIAGAARVVGAIACLAIAVLMMVNGRGLMSVMPYVIMVAYGCAALWGLTTYKGKVTVRQFAIEMCVLVAVTLTLRTASPEMFSVDGGQDTEPVRAVIKPHLPKNALGRYTEKALELLKACDELGAPQPTTDSARVDELLAQIDPQSLAQRYLQLEPAERTRVDGINKRVKGHADVLKSAVQAHRKSNGPDSLFRPSEVKHYDAIRELSAALLRAQGLRARILVVPDGVTSDSLPSTGN